MEIRPEVTYTPYATYSKKKTGDIFTFTQFEEGYLFSKTREYAESNVKYDDDSIMPPLLSLEEMYVLDSDDESDDETMSTEMLEDILDGDQSHPEGNRRDTCYKIRDCMKKENRNGKER